MHQRNELHKFKPSPNTEFANRMQRRYLFILSCELIQHCQRKRRYIMSLRLFIVAIRRSLTHFHIELRIQRYLVNAKTKFKTQSILIRMPILKIVCSRHRRAKRYCAKGKQSSTMASADARTVVSRKTTETTESASRNTDASTLPLYIQLLALEDGGGVITNAEPFDCVICLTTINTGDGVRLRNCLHQFCRDCLNSTIIHCEEADVACPFGDGSSRCESILQDREIRAILTKSEFDQHLMRTLRIAEITTRNAIHCKLVNCDGWCICEDGVNEFKCPECDSVNCVSCQVSHT